MPEYLSPGVYVQEVPSKQNQLRAESPWPPSFGFAAAGPANQPVLITNWSQYVNTFGSLEDGGQRNPHVSGTYLSHAVYGYFLNGGGRCYVTRVVGTTANQEKPEPIQLPSRSSKAVPSLIVHSKGNTVQDILVDILPPSKTALPPPESDGKNTEQTDQADQPIQGLFNLHVRMGSAEELYENLTLGKQSKSSVETMTQSSQLVKIIEAKSSGTALERAPELGSYIIKAPPMTTLPQVQSSHFSGNVAERSGLEGLEVAEDVTMVCCPDLMAAYQGGGIDKEGVKAVQLAMIAHCERMGDRIAILDPLPDLSPQEVKRWREQETNYDSKYAALYYPWIKVAGNGRTLTIPPSGHIAGIYARNDNERGVHKAPANEVIRGAMEAVMQVTKGEQDLLNPQGINCIRSFTGRGLRVWGARTLSSEADWRYVNVRRLFNYVEKSIELGTQWVVFEPNDPDLWARVKRDVGAFLTGAWREGMLFGRSPEEAFFVKCDEENNPSATRDLGQLFIDVGLAPVKPAEFVVFRLSQWSGGGA